MPTILSLGKNWTWSDQTTFDYVNWSKGRPDDMSKDKCVQTASDRTHHEIITEHEWQVFGIP